MPSCLSTYLPMACKVLWAGGRDGSLCMFPAETIGGDLHNHRAHILSRDEGLPALGTWPVVGNRGLRRLHPIHQNLRFQLPGTFALRHFRQRTNLGAIKYSNHGGRIRMWPNSGCSVWPSSRLTLLLPQNAEEAAELKKKRTFRKFSFRGIDLDQYVSFPLEPVRRKIARTSTTAGEDEAERLGGMAHS